MTDWRTENERKWSSIDGFPNQNCFDKNSQLYGIQCSLNLFIHDKNVRENWNAVEMFEKETFSMILLNPQLIVAHSK